jgi:hypothetical protein
MRSRIALACAIALILVTGVAVVARHRAGYADFVALRRSTAEGRGELRAVRREPVLDYRAPGTRPRTASELAAGKDVWGADQPTEVRRRYFLESEPGEAVDAYRSRAEAGGWRLVEARCSFWFRSTSVTLAKDVAGRAATLVVSGNLESPRRSLLVSLTGEAPARPPQAVMGSALRRHDIGCLGGFDPDDPTLRPSARQPQSGAQLCGLLDPAEARRIVATAFPAQAEGQGDYLGCRYGDTSRGGFLVRNTGWPRAFYDDQRSARDRGRPSYVLLGERTDVGPQGAWVDTHIGPVEIYGGGTQDDPGLDARQLAALAELLLRGR